MKPSAVHFELPDASRVSALAAFFDRLVEAKRTGDWPGDDEWLDMLGPAERSTFWWPTPEELEDHVRRWTATPVDRRFTDPSLQTPCDFGSMIEAFRCGDYELLACTLDAPTSGRLVFFPNAWPYGGTGCFHALVEAFGGSVTREYLC